VNDHVDTDCKRPGPKFFFGTECEKEIYESSHRVAKSWAWFESQRNTAIDWGDKF
jgi:hypothetical protein